MTTTNYYLPNPRRRLMMKSPRDSLRPSEKAKGEPSPDQGNIS